jgi:hypothetical protein
VTGLRNSELAVAVQRERLAFHGLAQTNSTGVGRPVSGLLLLTHSGFPFGPRCGSLILARHGEIRIGRILIKIVMSVSFSQRNPGR